MLPINLNSNLSLETVMFDVGYFRVSGKVSKVIFNGESSGSFRGTFKLSYDGVTQDLTCIDCASGGSTSMSKLLIGKDLTGDYPSYAQCESSCTFEFGELFHTLWLKNDMKNNQDGVDKN